MENSPLTLDQAEFEGKRVFVRVDFNVPLDNGNIADDSRIRAALPTIKTLLAGGASPIIASHLGRPRGRIKDELSMIPVAKRLQLILGSQYDVILAKDVGGPDSQEKASRLKAGSLLLLENLRFEKEETENGRDFAKGLAELADMFVQDAFGACHRTHASVSRLPRLLKPALAGRLIEKEIAAFEQAFNSPSPPVAAIVGGAKVSDKIQVLEALLDKVDYLLIGGGMAYTFLLSQGKSVGDSLIEEGHIDTARMVIEKAKKANVELLLPCDHVAADRFAADAATHTVEAIPNGWMGLDIGPATQAAFTETLSNAATVIWNGPMGVFEMAPFRTGTAAIARALAQSKATSIVGGGDSVAAVKGENLEHAIHHLSTGGGAFLAMLEGKELPGLAALDTNS